MRQSFHIARHWLAKFLPALLLPLLVSCSPIAEFLGLRVRLDKIPVTGVSASLVDKRGAPVAALGPGESARLVIIAAAADGKEYVSVGAGHGNVALDNYTIKGTIITVSKRGDSLSLPPDPRMSEGRVAHLHIVPVAHANVAADLDIPVRYDIAFTANFSGANGMDGVDGTDGVDGMAGADGTPGTTDPATGATSLQGAGGNGTDGSNGGMGATVRTAALDDPYTSGSGWIRERNRCCRSRQLVMAPRCCT